MPYTKKTTTTSKKDVANKETDIKETNESKTINEPVVNEVVVEERKFNPEDTIPCRSIVSGGLYIEGSRSHILYSWADCGDVEDDEYRDLIVRVAGYSAYFAELNANTQNEIIARTEYEEMV